MQGGGYLQFEVRKQQRNAPSLSEQLSGAVCTPALVSGGSGGCNRTPQAGGFTCHGPGGQESKTKVPAGLVSGESSVPGLQMAALPLCPHMLQRACQLSVLSLIPLRGPYPHPLLKPSDPPKARHIRSLGFNI